MADFGAPVAAGVQGPQAGLQTLSSLMGLQQQKLGIARQQIGLSQAQQQLSQETSQAQIAAVHAQQTQALSQINPGQYKNADGTPNMQALTQHVLAVAPNLGPEYLTRFEDMATTGANMHKAFISLNQQEQAPLLATAGEYGGDPNMRLTDALSVMETRIKNMPKAAQGPATAFMNNFSQMMAKPVLQTGAQMTEQQRKSMALAFSRSGLGESEVAGPQGLGTPVPGTVSTGTQVIPTTTSRITGVTSAANAPPVASLHTQITLPNNQIAVLNSATGQYEIASAGGGSAAGGGGQAPANAPPAPAPSSFPGFTAPPAANAPVFEQQNWAQALTHAQTMVQQARQTDTTRYGNNMAISQEIRQLTLGPSGTKIGPGTPEVTQLVGAVTSRFGGSAGVTNLQTLESFLDRQAASSATAMGVPKTNLGNEQARAISGNIGMQVGALRAKNDYNEAMTESLHMYREGMDKVAGPAGTANPGSLGQYQAAWSKYFNPIAVEYSLAKARGDTKFINALAKTMSPPQAKRMLFDLEHMQALSSTGKLP